MINRRDSLHGKREGHEFVIYSQDLGSQIPSIVRQLKPVRVILNEDSAVICVWPYPRIYVCAFRIGAREYGTKKLIDGLWYYDGSVSPE